MPVAAQDLDYEVGEDAGDVERDEGEHEVVPGF